MQSVNATPILEIRKLSKSLSGRPILRDINVTLYPGEIFGFLGPNGSGKTTTIKLMLGLLNIDEGEIRICGHDIRTEFEAALSCIGGIIENPELYAYLTGRENLELFRRMYDDVPKSRIDEVVSLVGLQGRIDDKVSRYSLGMRQRLGVAQALLNHPKLLVLDEPTNGLDPEGIRDLRDLLKKLCREEQITAFVSSHLLSEIEQMCDRVGIIDRGMLIGVRSMEEMHNAQNPKDGKRFYAFRTPTPDVLCALLTEKGYACKVENGAVTVALLPSDTQQVLTLAVQNGVMLSGFDEVKRSLEDAFLEITHAQRAMGGNARAVGMNENAHEEPITETNVLDGSVKASPSEPEIYAPPPLSQDKADHGEKGGDDV